MSELSARRGSAGALLRSHSEDWSSLFEHSKDLSLKKAPSDYPPPSRSLTIHSSGIPALRLKVPRQQACNISTLELASYRESDKARRGIHTAVYIDVTDAL